MKKTIGLTGVLGVLLAIFAVAPAQAQLRFGLRGGMNTTTVHFSLEDLKTYNVNGFHIGPMMELTVPVLGVGFDAAILYTQKGGEVRLANTNMSEVMNINYIDVPLHLKWKFGFPGLKVYAATGPYLGFCISGEKAWNVPGNVAAQFKAKSFGLGWDFGGGLELLSHFQVGFNYGLGLTDNYNGLYDALSGGAKGKSRGWAVTAAFLF
jgi:hypothetical protein